MTYFASSRLGVFGRLIAFPFIVAAFAARAAAKEFRTEFGALKTDFVPAIRYVLTGDPDTTIKAQAGSKVSAFGDRIRAVFETYAADRLVALALLAIMPLLIPIFFVRCLINEDFFGGTWEGIVLCAKAVVTGERVLD